MYFSRKVQIKQEQLHHKQQISHIKPVKCTGKQFTKSTVLVVLLLSYIKSNIYVTRAYFLLNHNIVSNLHGSNMKLIYVKRTYLKLTQLYNCLDIHLGIYYVVHIITQTSEKVPPMEIYISILH